ncbi:hypothetical protein AGABI1DRAFT_106297, partial [Agaricus bisporus var. burnettii JB137-S8]
HYLFLTALASLLLGTSSALHIDNAGGFLARGDDNTAVLKPFRSNPLKNAKGDAVSKREPVVIKGLLQVRQSCPPGFGDCNNGRCCPVGGDCCTGGCCNAGEFCYATGCCELSETGCEQVTCCPTGTHCCKGGGCCETGDYCVSGGCCPIGKICVGGGGGGEITTRERSTTTHTTETTSTRTTSTSTTDFITSSFSSSALSPTGTRSPRPTAAAGQVSVTYGVHDSRITWSSGWTDNASGCTTSSRRTTIAEESFTVIVASASRIYLNVDVVSVVYDVYVNGLLTAPDSDTFLETTSCTYSQLSLIATTNINVTVVVVGVGARNGKRQISDDWSFQLNEIIAIGSEEDSDLNSGSNSDSGPSSGSGSVSEAAANFKVTWFQTITAILLVAFGCFW